MSWLSGDFDQFSGVEEYDVSRGRQVLQIFHDLMKRYSAYQNSFAQTLAYFAQNNKSLEPVVLEGLGMQARTGNLTDEKIKSAFANLVSNLRGNLPSSYQGRPWNILTNTMRGEAVKIDWTEAAKYVASDTGKTLVKGLQQTGESVITTMKTAKFILPFIPIAILVAIYLRARGGGLSGLMNDYNTIKKKVGNKL